jgi:hypothetical protein
MADPVDYDDLLEKSVAPWHVSDETCGPKPDPVVPFSLIFVAVLSRAGNAAHRWALRTEGSWLHGIKHATDRAAIPLFFVPEDGFPSPELLREMEEFNDIVLMPSGAVDANGYTGEAMKFIFKFVRAFQYRWLLWVQDDVFLRIEMFLGLMQNLEPPRNKLLASARNVGGELPFVNPEVFVLSRDIVTVLSQPELMHRLDAGASMGVTLNRWIAPLRLDVMPMQASLYMPQFECHPGAALHPAPPGYVCQ